MGLRFGRDRFLDVAPSGNNRIGSVGRLEIPGAVGEGLQIGGDVRAYRGANGELYLVPLGGQPVMIPAGTPATDGLYIGAAGSGCRVYRGAAGELYLVPLAGKQVVLPNEGLQIGADVDITRDANGNLSFQDTIVPYAKALNDLLVRQLICPYAWSEFLSGVVDSPWIGSAITGGTAVATAPVVEHIGIHRITSAAGANSGYAVRLGGAAQNVLILQGGEKMSSVISEITAVNTTIRSGICVGSLLVAVPSDGVYIRIIGTTLDGANVAGSVQSTTGTTYVITAGLWYRVESELNVAGTLVTFRCYLCSTGALVWSDTLSTNIPINVAVRSYVIAFSSAAGPTNLLDLDYVVYYTNRKPLR